jgi:hypothetical protein
VVEGCAEELFIFDEAGAGRCEGHAGAAVDEWLRAGARA